MEDNIDNKHAFFIKNNVLVRIEKDFMKRNENSGEFVQQYFIAISDDDFDLRIHQISSKFKILANSMNIDCTLFDDDFNEIDLDEPK